MNTKKNKKTLLSLFSGCGGMDIGFEGGFEVTKPSVNTQIHPNWISKKYTRPGWVYLRPNDFVTVFANDISMPAKLAWESYFQRQNTFHLGSIIDYIRSAKNNGINIFPKKVDIVTGGFPCQDFSVAGKRKGFQSHKSHNGVLLEDYDEPTLENRGMLYSWMREVISLVRPKVFIAENVKGLISMENVKEIIERDFRNIGENGYIVFSKVLHAAEYGVPQSRQRIIFIGLLKKSLKKNILASIENGNLNKELYPFPRQTHFIKSNLCTASDKLLPFVNCGTVLKGLPEPFKAKDLCQINYSKAKWMGKHCQGQTEVKLESLGPTIRSEHHGNIEFRRLSAGHGGNKHDELHKGLIERRLTIRECARIQSFPDDYHFIIPKGNGQRGFFVSASDAYKIIGNAVPPFLAYHIARRLQELWDVYFKK
jgi:DNA (cytosine-5)-methyltransferase 1